MLLVSYPQEWLPAWLESILQKKVPCPCDPHPTG